MNALWIWYIKKNDMESLIKVCEKYKIDTLLIHYNCYDVVDYIKELYPNRFKFELLIGDATIDHDVMSVLEIAQRYPEDIVHLNIEHYSRTKDVQEFSDKILNIMKILKVWDRVVTFDVQTWNHNSTYKEAMSYCDKLYLMSYSNGLIGTLWKILQWYNYPIYVGLELNQDYKRAFLHNSTTNIPIIDNLCKQFLPLYFGLGIHHFGVLK